MEWGYAINLDEYSDIGTHSVAFYVQNNNGIYFDNFGVEHIPKAIIKFIENRNTKQKFLEYKYMTQCCMDIFVLHLLILCIKVRT